MEDTSRDLIHEIASSVEEREKSYQDATQDKDAARQWSLSREILLERKRIKIIQAIQRLMKELEDINRRLRELRYRHLFQT